MFNDELLENLIGHWNLHGKMGKTDLHHSVAVEWALNHQFLKIHTTDFVESKDGAAYESVYFIGWNEEKQHYVFHLLDTFGGGFSETLGFGTRKGDSISFLFEYKDSPFENSFCYNRENDFWEMILRFKDQKNEWKVFARKKLQRRQ